MPSNLLDQLKTFTVVVADTGDFQTMEAFRPQDATTNPSLLATAAQMPEYAEIANEALREAKANAGATASPKDIVNQAMDRLAVAFGRKILAIIPGRVSTEVDARLSHDTEATLAKARSLIELYRAAGIPQDRILIKIASTWEGIRAAEVLEKEGIHCNLTLLFGLHQAIACAEAGVTLISPFVGRILDWHKKQSGRDSYLPTEDPGVVSVTTIYNYFKKHGHRTQVMGASFRNAEEILELAGCDLLTISPKLLGELAGRSGDLVRKLDPAKAKERGGDKISMNEATFRKMHETDRMANDKLAEGIAGFTDAIVELEAVLEGRLATLLTRGTSSSPFDCPDCSDCFHAAPVRPACATPALPLSVSQPAYGGGCPWHRLFRRRLCPRYALGGLPVRHFPVADVRPIRPVVLPRPACHLLP